MAAFYAAEQPGVEVNGVIWVAGVDIGSGHLFDRADVSRVTAPKLFISARNDSYGAAYSARLLYRWSIPPRHLELRSSTSTERTCCRRTQRDRGHWPFRFLERYRSP